VFAWFNHGAPSRGIELAMFSLRVLPRSITLPRFDSPRGFVFRDLSIRLIGSITRVGSEDSFMMKINNARRYPPCFPRGVPPTFGVIVIQAI